ncbi:MAG: MoaD/ThiS family protein [Chloroflexota bacterium]|nr:MAG: MoaD/ThiS family protein [Chloroflexota bacterium]
MSVTVRVPTPLRKSVGGAKDVRADGTTLVDLIGDLERQYPGLRDRLCEEDGSLRRFMNFYVNGEDIRYAQGIDTALKDGDELSIIPAVSGG